MPDGTAPLRLARARRVPRLGALGVTLLVAGSLVCAGAPSPASAAATGSVTVLSAGSLQDLMQNQVAGAFHRATGYTLNNISMGSTALASSISGGTIQADVFISAAPAINATLEGSAHGDWVSWYAQFASSPLVLGYNPSSSFAKDLRTKPWYEVVGQPGFRLGRTDPTLDPKGVLADDALDQAAAHHHLPALKTLATEQTNVFPEEALVGELQAGQLDAGFFYKVEAAAAKLKTVPLAGTSSAADFTITILNRAPHEAAAIAFVKFLLGKTGKRILAKNGVVASRPKVTGLRFAPHGVRSALK